MSILSVRTFLKILGLVLLLCGIGLSALLLVEIIRFPPDPEGLGRGILILSLVCIAFPATLLGGTLAYLFRTSTKPKNESRAVV